MALRIVFHMLLISSNTWRAWKFDFVTCANWHYVLVLVWWFSQKPIKSILTWQFSTVPCWRSTEGSKKNCTPSCGLSQQYCGGHAISGGVSLRLKAMKIKLMALRQVIILRVWLTASWLDQKIWPWSELITEVILAIRQDGWGGHHGGQWKGRGGLVMRTSCTMETTPPSIIINMIVIIINP